MGKMMRKFMSVLLVGVISLSLVGEEFNTGIVKAENSLYVEVNAEINPYDYDENYVYFKLEKPGRVSFLGRNGENVSPFGLWYCDDNGLENKLDTLYGSQYKGWWRLGVGTYKLRVAYIYEICFVEETADQYEQEWNDTFDTANEIQVNTTYTGNLNCFSYDDYYVKSTESESYDIDTYKFRLEKAGKVKIEYILENKLGGSGKDYNDNVISIYSEDVDKNVKKIFNVENFFRTKTKRYSETYRLPAGTYYIVVSGKEYDAPKADIGDYQLKVIYMEEDSDKIEKEYNNTEETANAVQLNTTYIGNMTENDMDYYSFELQEQSEIQLRIEVPRQTKDELFTFGIYESSKQKKITEITTDTNPVKYSNKKKLSAGKYYVLVNNKDYYFSGDFDGSLVDYSFTIQTINEEKKSSLVDAEYGADLVSENIISKLRLYSDLDEDDVLRVGDKFNLYAEAEPEELNKDLEVMWYSENTKIADVNQKGEVTCVGEGSTTIFVKTTDGSNITCSCDIIVDRALDKVNTLSKITCSKGKLTPRFSKNKTSYTLTLDSDVSNSIIQYKKTSGYSNATIDGKRVSKIKVKLGQGKSKVIKITVTAENGKKKIYKIKVKRKKSSRKTKSSSGNLRGQRSKKQLFNAILKDCRSDLEDDESEGFLFMSYESSIRAGLSVSYKGDEDGVEHYVVDVPGTYFLTCNDYKKKVYAEFDVYYSYWSGHPSYSADLSYYYNR